LRRRILVATYVVVAAAAVLGVVEWLARRRNHFGYIRSDSPEIVYELRRGYPDHNSFGYRDREYTLAKKPGVFRVIGLGDSYTYGAGVERDQVFLKVAERMLDHDLGTGRVEILNFGLPGSNTAMEAAMLEQRTAEWDPDLVVIQWCRNDFNLPNFIQTDANVLVAHSFALHELLSGLAVRWPTFVKNRIMAYDFDEDVFPVPGLQHVPMSDQNPLGDPDLVPERYQYMLGGEGVQAALLRIARESERRRVPVIFVVGWGGEDQDVAEWARMAGLEVLDIWSPVAERFVGGYGVFQDLWVSPADGDNHPNVEGHGIMGAALASAIGAHLR
jgi:lysophospholipase L1-like esterase